LRILFLIGLLYLILQGVKIAYGYGHGLLYERAMEKEPGREITLEIKQGESAGEIADKLKGLGLIDNTQAFVLKAKLYHTSLLPGSYTLSTAMTQLQMLDFIAEEGKKNQELSDKNLVKENEGESETEEENVISGGNENEQDNSSVSGKQQEIDAGNEGEQ
jgi:hypothetical protein